MFEARRSPFRRRIVALASLVAACAVVLSPAPPASAGSWTWPVDGDVLTPYRNGSDPYAAGQHRGLDIASPVGAPVRAASAGTVTYAGRLPDSGNCVTVATADGRHLVSYLHLSSIAVKRDANVRAGSTLGAVGLTGKRSVAAPHLHLSVRTISGTYVDPLPLLGPRPVVQAPAPQQKPVAKPLAAQPPSAARPPQSDGESVERDRVRQRPATRGHVDTRADRQRRAGNRTSRPRHQAGDQVHAPPPGDTVAAAPAFAAAGSAREGHASRGRVAPPPLAAERAGLQRLTADDVTGEDARGATVDRSVISPDASSSHGAPWILIAAAIGGCAAIALFLRRRRSAGHDPEPIDGEVRVVIERPAAEPEAPSDPGTPALRVVGR